jgi:hypothetical protein
MTAKILRDFPLLLGADGRIYIGRSKELTTRPTNRPNKETKTMKTNKNIQKIVTVGDVRREKALYWETVFAREDAKAVNQKKPHATDLHPAIGTINRWDKKGNPFYYTLDRRDGSIVEHTDLQALMSIVVKNA